MHHNYLYLIALIYFFLNITTGIRDFPDFGSLALVSGLLGGGGLSFLGSIGHGVKECQEALADCSISAVSCTERLGDCVGGLLVGKGAQPKISDLGDVEVPRVIERLALEAHLHSPRSLEKLLLKRCTAYLPASARAFFNKILGTPTLAQSEDFMCKILTDRDVGQFLDEESAPPECNYQTLAEFCEDNLTPVKTSDVLGTYFNILNGESASGYVAGQNDVPRYLRTSHPIGKPLTLEECLKKEDRLKCVAAMLLAQTCEDSCALAQCAWKQMEQSQCVDAKDKNAFFASANAKCQKLANAMASVRAPVCGGAKGWTKFRAMLFAFGIMLFFT